MLDKTEISRNFSRSAPNYEQHAVLQKQLADELTHDISLHLSISPSNILDLGCGTGYLTRRLAELFPRAEVVGIDLAPGMIETAKITNKSDNLAFMAGDGEKPAFPESHFDLIVSNASLQWMDLRAALQAASALLKAGGRFYFNTFGPATLKELRESGFAVNDLLSSEEIRALAEKDFTIESLTTSIRQQSFSNFRELLLHLKEIGAQGVDGAKRVKGSSLSVKKFRDRFSAIGKAVVSFEVISGALTVQK